MSAATLEHDATAPSVAPPRASLRRNISWTLAGNAALQASTFLLLSLISWLDGPGRAGLIVLGTAVVMPVLMFSNMSLNVALATDQRREFAFGDYLSLRMITSVVVIAAAAAITWQRDYARDAAIAIMLMAAIRAVESLSEILLARCQQHEWLEPMARSTAMRGAASLAAAAGVYPVTRSIPAVLGSLLFVRIALLFFYDLPVARKADDASDAVRPAWHAKRLRLLAWTAAPLGLTNGVVALNSSIPRLYVEDRLGLTLLGVFGNMTAVMAAGAIVVGAVGSAASPRLARFYAEGKRREFLQLLGRLVVVAGALGAVGIIVAAAFGRQILYLGFGPEVAEYSAVFPLVMSGAALTFIGNVLGYGITATRGFRRLLIPYALVAASVWGLSAWLIAPGENALNSAACVVIGVGVGLCIAPAALLACDPKLRLFGRPAQQA